MPAAAPLTDDNVWSAIQKGREYLINLQASDGSFGPGGKGGKGSSNGSYSAICFMTLAYLGEHPNRPVISKGMDYLMKLDPMTDFGRKQGYALPMRIMGLSYIHNKLLGENRTLVRKKITEDLATATLTAAPAAPAAPAPTSPPAQASVAPAVETSTTNKGFTTC